MNISTNYERFYARITSARVYPTEFVVQRFLAQYPHLNFTKPSRGVRVLDVAFVDGRNILFLCELGLSVSEVEITEAITQQVSARLKSFDHQADLRVGRNSSLPFAAGAFKYVLASHCISCCDEGENFMDNLRDYWRVLQPSCWVIASATRTRPYIFNDTEPQPAYGLRFSSRWQCSHERLNNNPNCRLSLQCVQLEGSDRSFLLSDNDYFGVGETVIWMVCKRHY